MVLIRGYEDNEGQLYGMGMVGGFCHLYIGQEAVVVGMQSSVGPNDQVVTAYRDHGHMLACGMDPKGVMAELTGRGAGYSKGKGGSMHMFSRSKRFYGGHGIVGGPDPVCPGISFAKKNLNHGAVCITSLCVGAANHRQMYNSHNKKQMS